MQKNSYHFTYFNGRVLIPALQGVTFPTCSVRGHVKAKGRVSDLYLERIDKELKTLQVWKEDDEHAWYVESSMESYSSAQHDCGAQLDRRY